MVLMAAVYARWRMVGFEGDAGVSLWRGSARALWPPDLPPPSPQRATHILWWALIHDERPIAGIQRAIQLLVQHHGAQLGLHPRHRQADEASDLKGGVGVGW